MTKFLPTSIEEIQKHLWSKIDASWSAEKYEYVIRKNIAYSFQYLQYLDKLILSEEEEHTTIIKKMLYKTFIITAFSILEAIIYHDLKKKGLIKKEELKELEGSEISNNIKNQKIVMKIKFFEKITLKSEQKEEFLKTKEIIKRAQDNNIFGVDADMYGKISRMNKLRDKVHIHISELQEDTDFNTFKKDTYERNKETFLFIYSKYFNIPNFKLNNL